MDKIRASIEAIAAEVTPAPEAWIETPCVGLSADLVAALDAWIATQPPPRPSHAEAIRAVLTDWLGTRGLMGRAEGPETPRGA